MKIKLLLPFTLLTLLSACSLMDSHAQDVDLQIQHDTLAKHFEDEANEIQNKVDEHKKLLNQFNTKSYVYGKHSEDLKKHSEEVIKLYEKLITSHREMSRLFSEMEH